MGALLLFLEESSFPLRIVNGGRKVMVFGINAMEMKLQQVHVVPVLESNAMTDYILMEFTAVICRSMLLLTVLKKRVILEQILIVERSPSGLSVDQEVELIVTMLPMV